MFFLRLRKNEARFYFCKHCGALKSESMVDPASVWAEGPPAMAPGTFAGGEQPGGGGKGKGAGTGKGSGKDASAPGVAPPSAWKNTRNWRLCVISSETSRVRRFIAWRPRPVPTRSLLPSLSKYGCKRPTVEHVTRRVA